MSVMIKLQRVCPTAIMPTYMNVGDSGADIYASIGEAIVITPGQRALVPSGFKMELPEGYEAQIRPRSGLALKYGITVANAPGTIDSGFRNEVCVILVNLGSAPYTVEPNSRIAQMVIAPVSRASFVWADELDDTDRGMGGFGSTGI